MREQCRDRAQRHDRQHDEDRAETEDIAGSPGKGRRDHIAGMIAALIAAELMRKALLMHQTERDRGDGGTDRRAGNAGRQLARR